MLEMLTDFKKKITPEIEGPLDCLRLFRFFYRIAGCLPFRVSQKYRGRRELVPVKHVLLHFGELAVIFAVILYGQSTRYKMIDPKDYVSYYGVVAVYSTSAAGALASTLILYFKRHHLINAIDIMRHIDTGIQPLGINVSYVYCCKIGCAAVCSLILIPIVIYTSNTPLNEKWYDVIAYHYSIMIRTVALTYPFLYVLVIHERFRQLNSVLIVLDEDDDDDDDCARKEIELKKKLSASFILEKVTVLHASLVEVTKYYNATFSLIVLVNVAGNIVQSTLTMIIMYCGNHSDITNVELVLVFAMCNIPMLGLVLFSYFIEQEAQNTLATLGHLNIYYFDQKLAFKKNTLLLQGLHNKVSFKVCGMFPLNASIFLQQITVCRTLFLLLLQNFNYIIRQEKH